MAYATVDEFNDYAPTDVIRGLADTEPSTVQYFLDTASGTIDSYLRGTYSLPLTDTPPVLKSACIIIAAWHLVISKGRRVGEGYQSLENLYYEYVGLPDKKHSGILGRLQESIQHLPPSDATEKNPAVLHQSNTTIESPSSGNMFVSNTTNEVFYR